MGDKGGRKLILAGDVGGTKTELGLYGVEGGGIRTLCLEKFTNSGFAAPEDIIDKFLEGQDGPIASAVLGVAAPVADNECTFTNLTWSLDGGEIGKRFDIGKVKLINDLVATAWGIGLLSEKDLYPLQPGKPGSGNGAVIAAGTGLGEVLLFREGDGKTLRPSASEGGHADFAPRTEVEVALLAYLRDKFGHVSYERVVSGAGLKDIYDFLRIKKGASGPDPLKGSFESEDPAAVIAGEALSKGDETCRKALGIFVSVYGAEAGNLALKVLPTGGLYVAGGIAPKIIDVLKDGTFMDAFRDKGRFREFLSGVPVYVVLDPGTALLGAAHVAARTVAQRDYTLA